MNTATWRGTLGIARDHGSSRAVAIALLLILVLAPGCLGRTPSDETGFTPGIVALPHVSYDPSVADQIARGARYSAWIDLEDEATLDLAVWPSRLAAAHALRQYRAGGPQTYPDRSVLGTGFPHRVHRVERLGNVTLAWYRLPTETDEHQVRHALRFRTPDTVRDLYRALWVMPGTAIDPDATAATGPARYSASLSSGAIHGPLTVAIWPSVGAARRYIDGMRGIGMDVKWRQIGNVTIDTAASFGSAGISDADEEAIRQALH